MPPPDRRPSWPGMDQTLHIEAVPRISSRALLPDRCDERSNLSLHARDLLRDWLVAKIDPTRGQEQGEAPEHCNRGIARTPVTRCHRVATNYLGGLAERIVGQDRGVGTRAHTPKCRAWTSPDQWTGLPKIRAAGEASSPLQALERSFVSQPMRPA